MIRRPPRSTRTDTLFPYTTLFRSSQYPLGRRRVLLQRRLQGYRSRGRQRSALPRWAVSPESQPLAGRRLQLWPAFFESRSGRIQEERHYRWHQGKAIAAKALLSQPLRPAERREGKEVGSTCRYRWSPVDY